MPTDNPLKSAQPPTTGPDLVAMARRTRQHAQAYKAIVDRYCETMPEYLDRFHDAMQAFRATADRLQGKGPKDRQSG